MARRKKYPTGPVDPLYLEKQRAMLRRRNRYVMLLNDNERAALETYCERFHVRAKSALFREAVMAKILSELDENHPTLF